MRFLRDAAPALAHRLRLCRAPLVSLSGTQTPVESLYDQAIARRGSTQEEKLDHPAPAMEPRPARVGSRDTRASFPT